MKELEKLGPFKIKDPLAQEVTHSKPVVIHKEKLLHDGVLLIFYGYHETSNYIQTYVIEVEITNFFNLDYRQMAFRTGLKLNLPVINIDDIILYALVNLEDEKCVKVKNMIQKAILERVGEPEIHQNKKENPQEYLLRKVNLIMNPPKKPQAKSDKGSKAGSAKGGKEPSLHDPWPEFFLNIDEEILASLFRRVIEQYNSGFIIETLDSLFVRQPVLALKFILSSVGSIRYIHCILFSYSSQQYNSYNAKLKLLQEENAKNLKQERVDLINYMDADAFEKLNAEDLKLFKEYVLEPRKQKRAEKLLGYK